MQEMTTRERFKAVMNFQPFDRLPLIEWAGWWTQTIDRWRGEGLPADLAANSDIRRHFGLDAYYQTWIAARSPQCPPEPAYGTGIIASLADYEAIRRHLYPRPLANREEMLAWRAEHRRGNCATWFTFEGFFWFPRILLGIEPHLYAFYDQPDLMHYINSDLCAWLLEMLEEICETDTPDFMTFAEDLSYNHGPMLSKALWDEFIRPYYLRIIPRLKERGIIALIDSDGDIAVPAAWFEEAGLEGILPLEKQAGNDIAALRAAHPRMRFIGNFDKLTMHRGEPTMRAEFERLLPTAGGGGFLISCDHQTPPAVSYSDYKLYVSLFREYAEKAGRLSAK